MTEKNRRIYYQDIVYKVCNLLDRHYGRKPGTGLVCGTIEEPSNEVQDELVTLLNEYPTLKAATERLSAEIVLQNIIIYGEGGFVTDQFLEACKAYADALEGK